MKLTSQTAYELQAKIARREAALQRLEDKAAGIEVVYQQNARLYSNVGA